MFIYNYVVGWELFHYILVQFLIVNTYNKAESQAEQNSGPTHDHKFDHPIDILEYTFGFVMRWGRVKWGELSLGEIR